METCVGKSEGKKSIHRVKAIFNFGHIIEILYILVYCYSTFSQKIMYKKNAKNRAKSKQEKN